MTETSKTVQTDYTTALQTEQLIYLFNAYIAYIATHWSTRCEHQQLPSIKNIQTRPLR